VGLSMSHIFGRRRGVAARAVPVSAPLGLNPGGIRINYLVRNPGSSLHGCCPRHLSCALSGHVRPTSFFRSRLSRANAAASGLLPASPRASDLRKDDRRSWNPAGPELRAEVPAIRDLPRFSGIDINGGIRRGEFPDGSGRDPVKMPVCSRRGPLRAQFLVDVLGAEFVT
jgi:hypothetical protein